MIRIKLLNIIICAIGLFTAIGCSNSNDSAFKDTPTIKPKTPQINFMFPPYSPVNRTHPDYMVPEDIAENEKLVPNGAIIIILNNPIDRSTIINGRNIKVRKMRMLSNGMSVSDNDYLEGTISHKTNDNTILFIPSIVGHDDMRMEPGCVFQIILDGVKDHNGQTLAHLDSLFVTKEDIDDAAPYILCVEKIVTRDNKVTVLFEEPLDPRYVSEETVTLHTNYDPGNPSPLPINVNHESSCNIVTLKPIGFILEAGVAYTIVLQGGHEHGVRDLAGNVVEYQEISFSRAQTDYVPIGGGFVVNNGQAVCSSQDVMLNIFLVGATRMRFSNDNANWSEWENFSATKIWLLSEGFGSKIVYGQFMDRLNIVETRSYSIEFAEVAPF